MITAGKFNIPFFVTGRTYRQNVSKGIELLNNVMNQTDLTAT